MCVCGVCVDRADFFLFFIVIIITELNAVYAICPRKTFCDNAVVNKSIFDWER